MDDYWAAFKRGYSGNITPGNPEVFIVFSPPSFPTYYPAASLPMMRLMLAQAGTHTLELQKRAVHVLFEATLSSSLRGHPQEKPQFWHESVQPPRWF